MSGIGNATQEMLREFDRIALRENLKIVAIVPFGKKKYVKDKYRFVNVKVRSLPPGQKYVNYALTRTNLPIFPDIFYGRGTYIFPNYKTWWTPMSKTITFVHDVAHEKMPEVVQSKNLTYMKQNFPTWLKRADYVAAISKSSANDISLSYPSVTDKIRLIYLGVDSYTYKKKNADEVSMVSAKYGLPQKYLVYVGNIEPRKNILMLLEAYKEFIDTSKSDLALVMIGGGGWSNEEAKVRMRELRGQGYSIVTPDMYVEDEDLPAIYSGATALIHVALYEGFGLSLLQAMACGLPVIAGNNSSMPEAAGDAGILVDVANKGEIVKAIDQVAHNRKLREELQSKGYGQAKKFSWSKTCKNLLEL